MQCFTDVSAKGPLYLTVQGHIRSAFVFCIFVLSLSIHSCSTYNMFLILPPEVRAALPVVRRPGGALTGGPHSSLINWLYSSSSSGSMSDPDLGCHDAPCLSVLWCSDHFHSFYSHPVAQTLCKCQSLFSSVSLSFNLSCHDCIFNFPISHNIIISHII